MMLKREFSFNPGALTIFKQFHHLSQTRRREESLFLPVNFLASSIDSNPLNSKYLRESLRKSLHRLQAFIIALIAYLSNLDEFGDKDIDFVKKKQKKENFADCQSKAP